MKKVGIITYHHAFNYGTLLQAYATQRIIEKEGYEAEFINYQQKNQSGLLDLVALRIKRLPLYLIEIRKYYFKRKMKAVIQQWKMGMADFSFRMLKEGKKLYQDVKDIEKKPPQYDAYIVGSDQTWNQNITNNTDALYLSFVSDNSKKGSYAPSIGVSELTVAQENRYRNLLLNFKYLSCRESTGAALLEAVLGRCVTNVLDPTLMMNKEEWIAFSKPITIKKPYILTYFLGENKWFREFAYELSQKYSLKIINIPTCYLDYSDKRVIRVWPNPEQYVYLIQNSELVLSDSFHGTAFSVNLNKRFYSFIKNPSNDVMSQSSRIKDLLSLVGLSNRLINEKNYSEILNNEGCKDIDYLMVNERLEDARDCSHQYLVNMLNDITK